MQTVTERNKDERQGEWGILCMSKGTKASIQNVWNFTKIDVTKSIAPTDFARTSSKCKDDRSFSLLTQTVWIPYTWTIVVTIVIVVKQHGTLFIGNKR